MTAAAFLGNPGQPVDAAARRQLTQLIGDLASALVPWRELYPEIAEYLPRDSDRSEAATRKRVRLLRAIVERAERSGL